MVPRSYWGRSSQDRGSVAQAIRAIRSAGALNSRTAQVQCTRCDDVSDDLPIVTDVYIDALQLPCMSRLFSGDVVEQGAPNHGVVADRNTEGDFLGWLLNRYQCQYWFDVVVSAPRHSGSRRC